MGIVASATFALFSALYLYYFFTDPFDVAAATQLLATDIGAALEGIASSATEYKFMSALAGILGLRSCRYWLRRLRANAFQSG